MRLVYTVAALLTLVMAGCGPPREGNHPLMIKADTQIKIRKYADAVKSLKQYLRVNPESGRAHQLLAQLYDENLNRPELAVYHYTLCLEENPHIQGAADIRKFLKSARKRAYDSLKQEYNDTNTVSHLSDKLAITQQKNKVITKKNKHLVKIVDSYKRHIFNLNKERRSLKLQLEAAKTAKEITNDKLIAMEKRLHDKVKEINLLKINANKIPESTKPEEDEKDDSESMSNKEETTEEPAKAAEPEQKAEPEKTIEKPEPEKNEQPKEKVTSKPVVRKSNFPDIASVEEDKSPKDREYTVKAGDTLSSISRKFYGTSRHYNTILEANKSILSSAAKLKTGQKLKIPHLAVPEKK